MRAIAGRCRRLSALVLWGLVILAVGAFAGVGETSGQEPYRTGLMAVGRDGCSETLGSAAAAGEIVSEGRAPAGEEPNHAGLVIAFEDGRSETRCIEFAEEEISGAELLRRSGLVVVFSSSGGFGEGVCRIGDTGCSDPGDCFCQCRGADCAYWSYFSLQDGEWRYQNVGASQRRVRDGDVDGWVWGPGRTPPPQAAFGDTCPLAASTSPSPVPSPTSEERPPGESPNAGSDARPTAPPAPQEPVAQPEDAESAVLPASSPPSEADDRPAEAGPTVGATPVATDTGRQAVSQSERSALTGRADETKPDATAEEASGGGLPAGLIAFGAVAGLLAAAIGGLALRRRSGG